MSCLINCDLSVRDLLDWGFKKTGKNIPFDPPRYNEEGAEVGNPLIIGKCPGCGTMKTVPVGGHGEFTIASIKQSTAKSKLTRPRKIKAPVINRSSKSVYVIGPINGAYKIGVSGNVSSRFATLQSGSPVVLELVCAIPGDEDLEKKLHRKFWDQKVRGEWFILSMEDLEELRMLGRDLPTP